MGRALGLAVAAAVLTPFAVGVALAPSDRDGDVVVVLGDPEIVEASGLVVRDGRFVTVNDSGDVGRVFTVDDAGETVGVTTWGDATDVEAVAPSGPGEVLVGDIGDNFAQRPSVQLLRVPVGRGDRAVDATTYELTYPDGPQDAESLAVHPRTGRVVVVTKGLFGGRVMLAPARLDPDGDNELREVGVALGLATDAAFFPDGRHLVVRNYSEAVVYTWPGLASVGRVTLPEQPQGEGIAVDEDGAVYLSSEGGDSEVLRLRLPARIVSAMQPTTSTADPSASASPDPYVGDEDEIDRGVQWPWVVGGLLVLALGLGVVGVVVLAVVRLMDALLRRRR